MEWEDQALIIHTRPYSDNQLIVTLLTANHGKRSGMVRLSRQKYGNPFQIGTLTASIWRARLENHLGFLQLETIKAFGAAFLHDPLRLKLLTCSSALAYDLLADHENHPEIFQGFLTFFDALSGATPLKAYIYLELLLLKELGYGLELSQCAVTQTREDLVYVSPKTGRSVCRKEGEAYHDKLLTLPKFLVDLNAPNTQNDLQKGLTLTGYFLQKYLYQPGDKKLPPSRSSLF